MIKHPVHMCQVVATDPLKLIKSLSYLKFILSFVEITNFIFVLYTHLWHDGLIF